MERRYYPISKGALTPFSHYYGMHRGLEVGMQEALLHIDFCSFYTLFIYSFLLGVTVDHPRRPVKMTALCRYGFERTMVELSYI